MRDDDPRAPIATSAGPVRAARAQETHTAGGRVHALLDSDPGTRNDAVRAVVTPIMCERRISAAYLSRRTQHAERRFRRMLEPGSSWALPLRDLALLVEELGLGVLEPFAAVAGYRLVPHVGAVNNEDLVAAVASVMRETGEAAAQVAGSIHGGVTPRELAQCVKELAEARRAIDALEAALESSVVQPPTPLVRR